MKKRYFAIILGMLLLATNANADYPLFWQRYTADPWAIECNERIYMYCSHDTYNPNKGYGYYMNDITCISTDDLKNWTDHGEVFRASDSKWGAKLTWAPCVVERGGKFYMYYGNGNAGGIGVAVSDSPAGPFTDTNDHPLISLDTPGVLQYDDNHNVIKSKPNMKGALGGSENWGMWCFDPSVLVDDDGQAYLYFGGAHPDNSRVIRLKSNMTETDGTAVHLDTPGFFEASCVHKYKGGYYYSYSSHCFNIPCDIDYVTSKKPMSGFSNPQVAMLQPPVNDGMNHHHCIFKYKGGWYMAYHNREVAYANNEPDRASREYMRSVCLDRLYYNADGSIKPVTATRDGLVQLKYIDPFINNEAETMAKGWKIQTIDVGERCGNRAVMPLQDGSYVKVRGVDFGKRGASLFSAVVACAANGSGNMEVRLESPDGLLAGILSVLNTGGRDVWKTVSTAVCISGGVYDVYFVFHGKGSFLFDNWMFK